MRIDTLLRPTLAAAAIALFVTATPDTAHADRKTYFGGAGGHPLRYSNQPVGHSGASVRINTHGIVGRSHSYSSRSHYGHSQHSRSYYNHGHVRHGHLSFGKPTPYYTRSYSRTYHRPSYSYHSSSYCPPYSSSYYYPSYSTRYYPSPYSSTYYSPTTYKPNYSSNARIIYGTPTPRVTYTAPSDTPSYPSATDSPRANDGWVLLDGGHVRSALTVFAADSQANPNSGLAKLGYALAAARISDHNQAVWAMRRAVRHGGEQLLEAPVKPLKQQLNDLVATYDDGRSPLRPADSQFMIAAIRYVQGQPAAAKVAIDQAINLGDTGDDAKELRGLIQQAVDAQRNNAAGEDAPSLDVPQENQ